jgi:SAM-dependent methyltransferase
VIPPAALAETPCEICVGAARFWREIAGYRHYRCAACGHLQVFPRPSQDELDAFYQKGEYYDGADLQQERLARDARARLGLLEQLAATLGLGRRVLDIGCATGIFLSAAASRGWDAHGVERSEKMAQRARSVAGGKVSVGILESMAVPGAPYPVVTAWEVVEHALDPRSFFRALASNVGSGGLLAVSTPLSNGLPARVLGARYPMLMPPEHLSLFTRRSLGKLAEDFGFDEVDYRSFSNLNAGSLASGLCRLLTGKRLENAGQVARSACLAAGFAGAWLPAVVDALGYGTEMQVVFRKRLDAR